jgi:argininosuccinate lyase
VLSILVSNVARVAGDIYLWSTYEFGMVEIDDGLAGTSSIMPQKKNPHSVERVRGLAGLSVGWLASVLGAMRSASSSDLEFLFAGDPTRDNVRATLSVLEIMRATLDTLILHDDVMHERAGVYWSTASNLADEMVRHANISFRTAHHVVGRLVRNAVSAGLGPSEVTSDMVDQAARETIGEPLGLNENIVRESLDAEGFLRTRLTPGSPNPERVLETVDEGDRRQERHVAWVQEKRALTAKARQMLDAAVDKQISALGNK